MEPKDIISSGILELYSSGLTSEEENIQVHEWIRQFPEIRAEIEEIQRALEEYAMAYSIQPDHAVKEKILDRITDAVPEKNPVAHTALYAQDKSDVVYPIPLYLRWMAAAGIVLLIVSLVFNYSYYSKFRSVSANLQTVQQQLDKQKEIATGMSKEMDVVTDKNALPVVLNGTPHAPDALAKIFWMRNSGQVYVDPSNLPPPPAGMQYQLWAIVDGKPVDGGMIATGKGIYRIQKMRSFGRAEAFAITLEKEGGSPTPNMQEMYVMAKI